MGEKREFINMAVLVSGGGTNLQAIIDAIDSGIIQSAKICCVISSNPNAYALMRAKNSNIPSFIIQNSNNRNPNKYETEIENILINKKIDLIVLAGFMKILSKSFINKYQRRIINVHPSLIPSFCGKGYYGLRVHEEALKKGVKITGATVHFVNEIPDGGEIIMQKAVCISSTDTAETLQKKVMRKAEWVILPKAIERVSRKIIKEEKNAQNA